MKYRTVITYSVVAVSLALTTLGCSPRISPLYRDFSIEQSDYPGSDIHERLSLALEEGGWTVKSGVTSNITATESRSFRSYGIYRMEVELEASPVGDGYVRLFIHPYRRYFTGARGKQPYLKRGLAQSVLKTLEEPFASYGLKFAGTAESRDRAFRNRGR